MLKISDFSRLSRISIRMLRYYDEKDILKPTKIEENGYRYYEGTQMYEAVQINHLRLLGFGVEEIRDILSNIENKEQLLSCFQLRLKELEIEKQDISSKVDSLMKTIETLQQEEKVMNYNVEVKEFNKHFMMCKRGVIPAYDQEGMLWKELMQECYTQKVKMKENGVSLAMFHDETFKEKDVEVEIMGEVEGAYENKDGIEFKEVGPYKVAAITFVGGYENITDVCIEIAQWINDNDYKLAGPNFSIYHVGFGKTNNPKEFVTEICYPIE